MRIFKRKKKKKKKTVKIASASGAPLAFGGWGLCPQIPAL